MTCIKKLLEYIEELREVLEGTIQEKKNLLDPEIVYVSKQLDILLNEYNKLK